MSVSTALSNDRRFVCRKSAQLPPLTNILLLFEMIYKHSCAAKQKKGREKNGKLKLMNFTQAIIMHKFTAPRALGRHLHICIKKTLTKCIYEVNGDMPTCLGSVGTDPGSKFFINSVNQCLVDLSSCRHAVKVASRSWSGKHWRNASRALNANRTKRKLSNFDSKTITIRCNLPRIIR